MDTLDCGWATKMPTQLPSRQRMLWARTWEVSACTTFPAMTSAAHAAERNSHFFVQSNICWNKDLEGTCNYFHCSWLETVDIKLWFDFFPSTFSRQSSDSIKLYWKNYWVLMLQYRIDLFFHNCFQWKIDRELCWRLSISFILMILEYSESTLIWPLKSNNKTCNSSIDKYLNCTL